ncbi:MAG: hypothetical protein OSA87_03065 [Woeseiaceae bacterium]|jgi:hypothetical protein|nr:hypothetical protein [Woeseiaceae bacterium]
MNVGKIVTQLAVLAAVVSGLWSGFPEAGLVLAVLGGAAGYYAEDRQGLLVSAIALSVVAGGLGAIPAAGEHITGVMNGLAAIAASGSVVAILVATFEKVKP